MQKYKSRKTSTDKSGEMSAYMHYGTILYNVRYSSSAVSQTTKRLGKWLRIYRKFLQSTGKYAACACTWIWFVKPYVYLILNILDNRPIQCGIWNPPSFTNTQNLWNGRVKVKYIITGLWTRVIQHSTLQWRRSCWTFNWKTQLSVNSVA